jgi:hypothetical protein
VAFALMLGGSAVSQAVDLDLVARLPWDDQCVVIAGLRRAGLLDPAQIVRVMKSCEPDRARVLVQELANFAPLAADVWQSVHAYAEECPIELLPDLRWLLIVSQVLDGGEDFWKRLVRRGEISPIPELVLSRLAHCIAFETEMSDLTPATSATHLFAKIGRMRTREACELAVRLLMRRPVESESALEALRQALARHGRVGVENSVDSRCDWIPRAICQMFPDSLVAVQAWAYIACNGNAMERSEAHAVLRGQVSGFAEAIPYIKSCLAECDPLDSRVHAWLVTLALHPVHWGSCREELGSVVSLGEGKAKRMASSLLALSDRR